jgi:hypothetical protein
MDQDESNGRTDLGERRDWELKVRVPYNNRYFKFLAEKIDPIIQNYKTQPVGVWLGGELATLLEKDSTN